MPRPRLRDLGITIGRFQTGPLNAITDIPEVSVGQTTLIRDHPRIARTGVTVIVPRAERIHEDLCFAGFYALNGFGEITGMAWVEESGLLSSPIALTNSNQVGLVHETLVRYGLERYGGVTFGLPVVAETYDGWLNDIDAFHLTKDDVLRAVDSARPGPVEEGNVGGGTGNICHDLKGGIGTASRLWEASGEQFTVGALVQANHGDRHTLRVDGVPVGLEIGPQHTPLAWPAPAPGGSIVIILATDAPLLPGQCKRLARRATVGLARAGGIGHNSSGDIFLAFATGNHYTYEAEVIRNLRMLPNNRLDPLFEAAAEAVEEAILNSLTAAETMTGVEGHIAHALPLDELQRVMRRYRPRA
jgi:D-aminopeptidase